MKTTVLVLACVVIVMTAPVVTFAHDCVPLTTVTSGRNPCYSLGADCSSELTSLYHGLIRAQEGGNDTRYYEGQIMKYFADRDRKMREDIDKILERHQRR